MKRKLLKALAVLTSLVFASCSIFNTFELQAENTNDKAAYITIGLGEQFRTALPTVSAAGDFDSFKLTGIYLPANGGKTAAIPREFGSWDTDSVSTAYEKMTAAKIEINAGATYNFTLTATKGGATWEGKIKKTIETGINSLSFTLALTTLSNQGAGSINISLSVPQIVKAVDATLKTMDESQTVTPGNADFSFVNSKATYIADEIPAGNYVLVFTLWGDEEKTLKLNYWREYAGITYGLTSSSNPVIASDEEVGEIYQITLNLNNGELINCTIPGSYTRFSNDIVLPQSAIRMDENGFLQYPYSDDDINIYRKNYLFEGWYDDVTDGDEVELIPSGSTGNKSLYAYWNDTFTVDVDEFISEESVDDFGEYLEDSLEYLLEHDFNHINLKLTDMADTKALAGLSTFNFQSIDGYQALNDYVDERFTKIFNAICSAQGTLAPRGSYLGFVNGNFVSVPSSGYTYSGLGISLDLSETSLTYLPAYAFADSEQYASGNNSISLNSLKKPVNLIEITLPESLTALLPKTFVYSGFVHITIPKNVTFMKNVFSDTEKLFIDFESESSIETIDSIASPGCLQTFLIPASVKEIKDEAFHLTGLTEIAFEGTKEQWKKVKRGSNWLGECYVDSIFCLGDDAAADLNYGAYGIIIPESQNGRVSANSIASTVGTEVTLVARPEDGYMLDSISVTAANSTPVTLSGTGATRTFLMPESNVTVTATFKEGQPTITVKASELDTLETKLLEVKNSGASCITVKITDMEDAQPAANWSTLDIENDEDIPTLMGYMDPRFSKIFNAIYKVQGEVGISMNPETGVRKMTYSGLGVKLDLSGTKLTYLPFAAFADIMSGDSGEAKGLLNLIDVILPQSLTALLQWTFAGTGFTEITIPKNVTYINAPFIYTQGLTVRFETGSKIETIDSLGTQSDTVTAVTIPASVKEIKDHAFYNTKLKEITFEEGSQLETIGEEAFGFCDLKTITLPATLESIGAKAFESCNLETINYKGKAEDWSCIDLDIDWYEGIPATIVSCMDYDIPIYLVGLPEYIGTKSPSDTKEVGDIIFSDGSAMPYDYFLENDLDDLQRLNAVAVIFYKGTGLNSGNDTTTVRTLGVGLYNKELAWCTTAANAYNLSINTIKCKPDTSKAEDEILSFTDGTANDRKGSDNLAQIATFLTNNGITDDTGDASKYPAFSFVNKYNAAGIKYDSGWYLPSLAEFYELFKNGYSESFHIGNVISSITCSDYTIDFEEYFWTSTQADYDALDGEDYCNKSAYVFYHFDDGIWPAQFAKEGKYYTCAIREF